MGSQMSFGDLESQGHAFSQVKVDSSLCRCPTLRSGHARTPSFRYQRA